MATTRVVRCGTGPGTLPLSPPYPPTHFFIIFCTRGSATARLLGDLWTDPLRQGEHRFSVKYVLGRATNRGDEGQIETERNKHPKWSSGRNDKGIAQVVNDLSNPL